MRRRRPYLAEGRRDWALGGRPDKCPFRWTNLDRGRSPSSSLAVSTPYTPQTDSALCGGARTARMWSPAHSREQMWGPYSWGRGPKEESLKETGLQGHRQGPKQLLLPPPSGPRLPPPPAFSCPLVILIGARSAHPPLSLHAQRPRQGCGWMGMRGKHHRLSSGAGPPWKGDTDRAPLPLRGGPGRAPGQRAVPVPKCAKASA